MNETYEIQKHLEKKQKQRKIFTIILIFSILTTIISLSYIETNAGITILFISIGLDIALIGLLKQNKEEINNANTKIMLIAKNNIEKRNSHTYEVDRTQKQYNKSQYTTKTTLITECENKFYKILKDNFNDKYEIHPQIPLSSIIEKHKTFENQYQNELYRVIDFGIFSKDSLKPLLLIEINDKTHNTKERRERDSKIKEICDIANIELMTFWTDYPNTEEYITNRIKKSLEYKI